MPAFGTGGAFVLIVAPSTPRETASQRCQRNYGIGYVFGAIAFLVCTAGSVRWEKLYRAELTGEPDQ